ncbi:urea ABC transporter permease subunit UrtC [Sedimenticola hydrogenitrophicus]|uniref:urea ABC transporter permease subunit UrtC n=1 Tax=Sedimenticola hydrogenitrophicus TaxID=2967975 RepID=UPI0021A39AEB|nr:urea ABC transporter permease subunit UrtC [Sedimenticola hydrogenitrophicus]
MNSKSLRTLIGYTIFSAAVLLLPLLIDDAYTLNKFSRYLILGLATLGLSLAWGYTGILNLGHAAFFGLGAYCMAMYLKLQTVPVHTGTGGLPDFMVWNNVEQLPWFWEPFHWSYLAITAGIGIPVLLAVMLGWFVFRARIAGVFVAIITLAMLVIINLLLIDQQRYTGGFNGITDLAWLTIGGIEFDPYSKTFYYLSAGSLVVCLLGTGIFTHTKAGLILQAIRNDPDRVRFLGYDVSAYQILAFALSAGIAGLAGMLYAMVLEFASPTFVGVSLSLSMVIWCAVGGRGSLLAATLGAILVNAAQGSLSENFLETWQLILGGFFVLIVLFLPKGLISIGELIRWRRKRTDRVQVQVLSSTKRARGIS